MKLFISADIEGYTGVALIYETHKNGAAYREFVGQMTREVVAACKAVHEAGVDEIVVKDGHGDTTNIDPFCVPGYVTLTRGKSGHPYNMMPDLDDFFDGVMYIGYHAPAGNPGSTISHAFTGNSLYIRLNGSCTSELMLNNHTVASHGVPVLLLSGDRTTCGVAREMVSATTTAATRTGLRTFTYRRAPGQVEGSIRQGVKKAMAEGLPLHRVALPKTFIYEVTYKDRKKAYQMSLYPGIRAVDAFINRLKTSRQMDVVTAHYFVAYQSVKEITAMDMEMLGKISGALGPSGFEGEVARTVAGYYGRYQVESDAMNSLYVRVSDVAGDRPVVQLGAHLDEYGFMVQCIHGNGYPGILTLGSFHLTSLPAHTVIIKTQADEKIRGIVMSRPVYFMNDRERASLELCIEDLHADIGTASRREVEEDFGVPIGDSMVPGASFSYDGEHGLRFGKAFDNRVGCTYIVGTMNKIHDGRSELVVGAVGAFAAQKEAGMRGTTIIAQVAKSDLATLFEGPPPDGFFLSATQARGRMKNGVQIRRIGKSYVSNPVFMEYIMELAGEFDIRY